MVINLVLFLRTLKRNKLYTAINILGLAGGMLCFIFIVKLIWQDLVYDQFHTNADHIYKVIWENRTNPDQPFNYARTSGSLAQALQSNIPEIQNTVRLSQGTAWIQFGNNGYHQNICITDQSFLDLFTFPLLQGDPKTALREPFSILLTQKMANKLFGNQNPLGKHIKIEERDLKGDYTVKGVLKDIPTNSTIQFDLLTAPTPAALKKWEQWLPRATYRPVETYLKIGTTFQLEDLEQKLQTVMAQYMGDDIAVHNAYRLQKFTRIHLYSKQDFNLGRQGDIVNELYHLALLAILILAISCFNYMNLTTALSLKRTKEIGIRKVFGAQRTQLTKQVLGESTAIAGIAFLVALCLLGIFLPYFNTLTGRSISFDLFGEDHLWLFGGSLFAILIGILSGSYPARIIASRQPIGAIKNTVHNKRNGIQKYLVISQLAISIFLTISMVVIYQQLAFIRTKDLGYDKERIIMLPIFWTANLLRDSGIESLKGKSDLVKQEFLNHPNILDATASQYPLGANTSLATFKSGNNPNQQLRMWLFPIDENFLDFFNIDLQKGRSFFNADQQRNATNQVFILNEEAVQKIGAPDPIGQPLENLTHKHQGAVVGVVKNFHFRTLHNKIDPLILYPTERTFKWLYLKIKKENQQETFAFLKKQWHKFIPTRPLEWHFLDERLLNRFYQQEIKTEQTINTFAVISVFILCLGLLGLVAFTTQQRKKEIGTRKVLGATHTNIMNLFAKEFLKLNLLANLIAWPLAYYFAQYWLQKFEYQFTLGLSDFLSGGLFVVAITLVTMSIHTSQAARANPIETLKEN